MSDEKLKYPIGKFVKPAIVSDKILSEWIQDIEDFPVKIRSIADKLSEDQLNIQYRESGWTIRQLIHHCADSHMNSFIRFKLALTEGTPVIKPYFQDRWANLEDARLFPIESSLLILDGVHERWTALIRSMEAVDLNKTFYHPEKMVEVSLLENIGIYAWHCNHHLAHITGLINRKNWFVL